MTLQVPIKDLFSGHVNPSGVTYDATKKTRFFAEELDALYGRLVSGEWSLNPYSIAISGTETITEDRDTLIRGLLCDGSTGPLLQIGAGTRLVWYPGKASLRAGVVTGTDWDDAQIGRQTFALGTDLLIGHDDCIGFGRWIKTSAGHTGAVLLGSGADALNPMVSRGADRIALGQGSDYATIEILAAGGTGKVGYTGVGLGATDPTCLLDIGASDTNRASIRLRTGSAPASPLEGDLWLTGGNLFGFIGGSSRQLAGSSGISPHAVQHEDGGADEVEISNLPTAELGTDHVLVPDGAGGVSWTDNASLGVELIAFGDGASGNYDVGLERVASDVLAVTAGTTGTLGTLRTDIGTASAPGIAFGDSNTGFYQTSLGSGLIRMVSGGSWRWQFSASSLFSAGTAGGSMRYSSGTATTPPFFVSSDTDTGLGWPGADQVCLTAGAVQGLTQEEGVYGATGPVCFVPDVSVDPSSNPTGGAIFYASNGHMEVRSDDGHVSYLEPAGAACYVSTAQTQTIGTSYVNCLDDGVSTAATTTSVFTENFTHTSPGRLTYTGDKAREFQINAALSMAGPASGVTWTFAVYKYDDSAASGATLVCSEIERYTSGSSVGAAPVQCTVELDTDDWIEVHVKADGAGKTLDVSKMNVACIAAGI